MNEVEAQILYLKGQQATRVLREGPALRIQHRGQADRLIPYRRLLRVHSFGQVQWHIDALLGCADYSVPVMFCRHNGELRASFNALKAHPQWLDLAQSLNHCLQTEEGAAIIKRWLKRQSQLAQQQARQVMYRKLGEAMADVNEATLASAVSERLNRQQWRQFNRFCQAHIAVAVCATLQRHHIQPDHPMLQWHHIELAQDLAEHLRLRLCATLVIAARRLKKTRNRHNQAAPDLFRLVLQWHEHNKKAIDNTVQNQITSLNQLLLEIEHAEKHH